MSTQVRFGESTKLWIGLDLGTQSVTCSIVDSNGTRYGQATILLTSNRDGARHEQDPAQWVSASRSAMARAIAQLVELGEQLVSGISGVAICSTSGTLATIDAAGSPTGPGIMYDDGRAAHLVDRVVAAAPELWAREGSRIQSTWALTKLAWLAEHGLPEHTAHIVHQGDVVSAAIAGAPVATDWSSALKSGYDLERLQWPDAALAALNIDPALLPAVVAPGTVIGESSAQWQRHTGLPVGTAIVAGVTDGCAAQFGAGGLQVGDWHSVLGTTLVIKGVTTAALADESAGIYSHRAPHDDLWLPGGASSVGAGALSVFLEGADLAELTTAAAESWAEGPLDVAYPLLGEGERFPISDSAMRGFLLSSGADGSDDLRLPLESLADLDQQRRLTAIFVGVACVERLCFERLAALGAPIDGRLSSSGGGSRNLDWVRMRATMLGRPITLLDNAEASVGMAALAAWGVTAGDAAALPFAEIATRMSKVADVVQPDPALTPALDEAYARFLAALEGAGLIDIPAFIPPETGKEQQ